MKKKSALPERKYLTSFKRVIDGDTVHLWVDLGFRVQAEINVRLKGVDTPEKGQAFHDEAANFVTKWGEENPEQILTCFGYDRYGRWIGDLTGTATGTILNNELLHSGLAVELKF